MAATTTGTANICTLSNPSPSANPKPFDDDDDDKPREECGVVGIYGDPEASRLCYLALHAMQHRGLEGAGIVAVNNKVLQSITGVGLVSDVFNQSKLDQLPGDMAIGHARYSTAGSSMLKNVQPFVAGYSSDTVVVLHLIPISKARPFFLRIVDVCEKLEGAYSMVFVTEDKLVAVRDPYGFMPLVMGRRSNGALVFASVYESRYHFGEVLATDAPVECDVVIAVPDSGVVAALEYAAKAGVPFQQGLIRSHYVGRTFIEPSQKIGDFGVKLKLSPAMILRIFVLLAGKYPVKPKEMKVKRPLSSSHSSPVQLQQTPTTAARSSQQQQLAAASSSSSQQPAAAARSSQQQQLAAASSSSSASSSSHQQQPPAAATSHQQQPPAATSSGQQQRPAAPFTVSLPPTTRTLTAAASISVHRSPLTSASTPCPQLRCAFAVQLASHSAQQASICRRCSYSDLRDQGLSYLADGDAITC
ncbi:Amidophosphoribosyltransferase 1 [Citrus sinensis]|nr:Amidophosphoribosyltransferase 1 [Citrus sinensis]